MNSENGTPASHNGAPSTEGGTPSADDGAKAGAGEAPSVRSVAARDWAGKTVAEVLDAVDAPYQEHLFVDHKPGSLTATAFHYPGEGWLYVYVTDYQHMKRFDIDRNWDVEAFKRETVDRVEFEAE